MTRGPAELRARLFRAALRVRPHDRAGFVRRACRSEPAIGEEVLKDLACHADGVDLFDDRPWEPTMVGLVTQAEVRLRTPQTLVGHVLEGRYALTSLVGRGGAGAVFAAQDRRRGGSVAVKLFARGSALDDDAVQREVGVLRGLAVPGVVPLLDEGDEGDLSYVVMPLLSGAPFPGRAGPVPWPELAPTALGLLETLARIHSHGVVHRDLKPANVLVDANGLATVLDVGASGGPEGAAPQAAVAGTPSWMAPEQREGTEADARADLYAFGLLVLHALTGRGPTSLRGDGVPGDDRVLLGAVLRVDAPAEVRATLARLLAFAPRDRFADALEVVAALRGAIDERGSIPGIGVGDRRRRDAEELRALFHGSVRVHHLPDDAAKELHLRTDGDPSEIVAELGGWERSGLVRREGERFVITRQAIGRLTQGAAFADRAAPVASQSAHADPANDDLLSAAVWAGPGARVAVLAAALGAGEEETAMRLASLRERGRMRTIEGDRHLPIGAVPASHWPRDRQGALRRRLVDALPPGAPGRLWNLVLVGSASEIAHEALARPTSDLGSFLAGLQLAARVARTTATDDATRTAVLRGLLSAAISTSDAATIEGALREIEMAGPGGGENRTLRDIARAALWTTRGEPARALRVLDATSVAPGDPLAIDVHRVRVQCGRMSSIDVEAEAVAAAVAWEERHPDAVPGALPLDWLAWRYYREARYVDAARTHERRADLVRASLVRVQALAGAASAWLAAGDLDAADSAARRGLRLLDRARLSVVEAALEGVLRSVAYQSGRATTPDVELATAAEALAFPSVAAPILLTEAAVAWRANESALKVRWARGAADRWRTIGAAPFAAFADALSFPPGHADAAELDAVRVAAGAAPPGIRMQTLALLAVIEPALADVVGPAVVEAADALRTDPPGWRREVLSRVECLAAVSSDPTIRARVGR